MVTAKGNPSGTAITIKLTAIITYYTNLPKKVRENMGWPNLKQSTSKCIVRAASVTAAASIPSLPI